MAIDPNDMKAAQDAFNKSLEESANKGSGLSDIFNNLFTNVIKGANDAGIKVKDITGAMNGLGDAIKSASDFSTMLDGGDNLSKLQAPVDILTHSFIDLAAVVKTSDIFAQFSDKNGASINNTTTQIDLLKTAMKGLGANETIINALSTVSQNMINNANEGEKLENSFISLSSAGGDLSKVFEGQGGQLNDLAALTTAYSNTIFDAANKTGLSGQQTMDFANKLKEIPGAMDQTIITTDDLSGQTNTLTAAMTLMSGTGRNQEQIMKSLTTAYDDFAESQNGVNNNAQKGAEFLATVSSVSTALHLRFKDVDDTMTKVADSFRFIGNETDATARSLGRYTDALRATGISGKASLDITSKMIDNIKEMNTGTKAFLSLRSGGPGGLQGSFQIDKMLREGKLDQVMQMAERSLKQQFGGKIVTQDESAQSQQAASQFMRQRSLLQSGAFGVGKGMEDAQAGKLLDALAKGDMGGAAKEIKTGQNALAAATKQGEDIQKRNNNELKIMNRGVEQIAVAAQLTALNTMRKDFGTTGNRTGSITQQMTRAGQTGNIQNAQRLNIEKAATQEDYKQQQTILERKLRQNLAVGGKGVAAGVVDMTGGVKDTTKDSIDALRKMNKEGSQQGRPRSIKDPLAANRQAVYDRAVQGVQIPKSSVNTALTAQAKPSTGTASKQDTMKINLTISHPQEMMVKKSDNHSVAKHNMASTTFSIDIDEAGY